MSRSQFLIFGSRFFILFATTLLPPRRNPAVQSQRGQEIQIDIHLEIGIDRGPLMLQGIGDVNRSRSREGCGRTLARIVMKRYCPAHLIR